MEATIRSNSLMNEALTSTIVYAVARLAYCNLPTRDLHIFISEDLDGWSRISVATW